MYSQYRNSVYWLNPKQWVCKGNHLTSKVYSKELEVCWYGTCQQKRPPMLEEVELSPVRLRIPIGAGQCAWSACGGATRANSKYCSRDCSNKNARARHAARKRKAG